MVYKGPAKNCEEAKRALERKQQELEAEKEERVRYIYKLDADSRYSNYRIAVFFRSVKFLFCANNMDFRLLRAHMHHTPTHARWSCGNLSSKRTKRTNFRTDEKNHYTVVTVESREEWVRYTHLVYSSFSNRQYLLEKL